MKWYWKRFQFADLFTILIFAIFIALISYYLRKWWLKWEQQRHLHQKSIEERRLIIHALSSSKQERSTAPPKMNKTTRKRTHKVAKKESTLLQSQKDTTNSSQSACNMPAVKLPLERPVVTSAKTQERSMIQSSPTLTCANTESRGRSNHVQSTTTMTFSSVYKPPNTMEQKTSKSPFLGTGATKHYKDVESSISVKPEKKTRTGRGEEVTKIMFDDQMSYVDTYTCTLRITERQGEAIPFDSEKEIVKIRNFDNRRGAFDGEEVTVGVFPENPAGKCYGHVIPGSAKHGSDFRLLCKVSTDNPGRFYPIDDKHPMIIRFLPPYLVQWESTKFNVFVFDLASSNDKNHLDIKSRIPLNKAQNMVFLVHFLRWGKDYRFPQGIVIGAYKKGHTQLDAENLLKVKYDIHYEDESSNSECATTSNKDSERDHSLKLHSHAFTIDPKEAKNLDDAISVEKLLNDVYLLGVHITNVAKHVRRDSTEDKHAKSKCTSVYSGKKSEKIMHMFPPDTRAQLSLVPGRLRDVLSVTCKVTIGHDNLPSLDSEIGIKSAHIKSDIELSEIGIESAQIKSRIQLSYEDAQNIMDGKPIGRECTKKIEKYNKKSDLSLQEKLKLVYRIACIMRRRRLGSDSAYVYECSEPEDENCWESHMMVEELMIWVNYEVAKEIRSFYPDAAILRRQRAPNEEVMKKHMDESKNILHHSLHLCEYLQMNDVTPIPLEIPLETLKNIKSLISDGKLTILKNLLTSDRLYPQLAVADSNIRSEFQPAEYCCTERDRTEVSEYRHHSLCLDSYTHFTSPLRRYVDLQVQRMLSEKLIKDSSQRIQFTHKEHLELCTLANEKSKKASHFEKDMKILNLAGEFVSNSEVYYAFISMTQKGTIKLLFPQLELKYLHMKLRISNLSAKRDDSKHYKWNVRITSLEGDLAGSLPQSSPLPSSLTNSDIPMKIYLSSDTDKQVIVVQDHKAKQQKLVVTVPSKCWAVTHEFIKNPTEENMKRLKQILSPLPGSHTSPTSVSCNALFVDFSVKVPLKDSCILRVWLTGSMRRHLMSPALQLVEISPLLHICVQHNTYPAECFSDIQLPHASKRSYSNISEYIELWKKVLLAEAAENTIRDCQPMIKVIHNVHLKWPELIRGKETGYICDGSVEMKLTKRYTDQCHAFFMVKQGDLLCVRYGCNFQDRSQKRSVYHFVVDKVSDDREDNKTVFMKPVGDMNKRVSREMKKVLESACQVQIISTSASYRRVYGGLLALKNIKTSQLSKNIATGSLLGCPNGYTIQDFTEYFRLRSQTIIDEDEYCQSISKWTQSPVLSNGKVLNEYQKEAMSKALGTKFQQIQGPPGTGKSETGAHIAYVFANINKGIQDSGCVLYCGPSNKSVDVVFEKFHQLLSFAKEEQRDLSILRIYSRAVERNDYPGPDSSNDQTSTARCPDWAKAYSLHHMIRDETRSDQVFIDVRNLDDECESTKNRGEIASGVLCNEYRKAVMRAEGEIFKKGKFDVVFCTCNEASGVRVRKNLSPRQCIIDECGMAYEPETIVPISLCKHAVLIGDHKQLQPVIKYQRAKECGLSTSLFERYAENYDERYTYTLKIQYRMHEAICAFPSKHFYGDQLETDDSIKNRKNHEAKLDGFWPQGENCPIVFVNTVGIEREDLTGRREGADKIGIESKFNQEEVNKVVEIARVLHERHRVELEQMAVLTPYSAQRSKIQERLPGRLRRLKVSSITESQGNEYGIVILSTVRSQPIEEIKHPHYVQADSKWRRENLGFITDPHQINVGITRSKYGLIIIGNKMLLEYDHNTWDHLLKHYEEKKCVVDSARFPIR